MSPSGSLSLVATVPLIGVSSLVLKLSLPAEGPGIGHVPGKRIGHTATISIIGSHHHGEGATLRGRTTNRSRDYTGIGVNTQSGWQSRRTERQRVVFGITEVAGNIEVDHITVLVCLVSDRSNCRRVVD